MIEGLTELLARQVRALELVQERLRALELLQAAGEHRFIAPALEDLERASERLAALELGRALTIVCAGLPADAAAADLLPVAAHGAQRLALAAAIDRLREVADRVTAARERIRSVVDGGAGRVGERSTLAASPPR